MDSYLQKLKNKTPATKTEKKIEDEDERRPQVTTNQTKKADENWDDEEEVAQRSISDSRTTGTKTKKTVNKTNQPTTWGETQSEVLKDEFKEPEPVKQKGVMAKPGTKKVQQAEIFEEEFPDLGAEIDPTKVKKKPAPQPQQTTTTTTSQNGARPKFTNTKKAVGEAFAELEATPEKKVEESEEKPQTEKPQTEKPQTEKPQIEKPHQTTTEITRNDASKTDAQKTDAPKSDGPKRDGGFQIQRGPNRSDLASKVEEKTETKPESQGADSKFKFGGEGPRKFVSAKKEGQPATREEHKTEADIKREEAERRAEEALQAERQKVAEESAKKKLLGHKNERPQDKQEGGEKKHENGKSHEHKDKKDQDGKPRGEKKNKNDEGGLSRSNEKGGDKAKKDAQPTKVEAPKEELPKGPATTIIKADQNAELSLTGWDKPIKMGKKTEAP